VFEKQSCCLRGVGGRGLLSGSYAETSWEDAGRKAVETAAGSLRDLRVAEVTKMDMKVDNGKVTAFRTRVALSFK
jgi:flavin-binding protein dodecin